MATGQQYTKTGPQERVGGAGRTWGEWFSMWSNRLSFIPFIGGSAALVMGAIGTGLETLSQLFKGNIGSAITTAATGAAATTVNSLAGTSGVVWFANAVSGVTTGSGLGTHARKLSEGIIGAGTGVFGLKPEILDLHVVGIGSLDNAYTQNMRGPGYWASRAAEEKGRDPRQMYDAYRNGAGAEHVSQLDAARATGPAVAGRA